MAQDPWAEFRTGPTPAQPQQPQQPQQAQPRPVQPQQRGPVYGPPVVQTPPNPVSVASENRQRQRNTWRVMSAEEAASMNLPRGVTYQVNGLNEIKPVGGQATAPLAAGEANRTAADAILRSTGVDLINGRDPVADLIRGSTSGALERRAAELAGAVTGEATSGMENIGALQTIQSDMTLLMSGGSLGAQISNSDRDFINQRMGDIANPNTPANMRLAAWEQVKTRLAAAIGVPYTSGGQNRQRDDQAGGMAGGTTGSGGDPRFTDPQGPRPTLQDMYPEGVQFGMDNFGTTQPFDRIEYLRGLGIEPDEERQFVGIVNAIARQKGPENFTREDMLNAYRQAGIQPGPDAAVDEIVAQIQAGRSFAGFDTQAAEADYTRMLDQRLQQTGDNPEGTGATVGSAASQGVTFGLADEATGVAEAIAASLRGENPITAYQVGRDTDRRFAQRAQGENPWLYGGTELGANLLTGGVRAAPAVMRAEAPIAAAAREGAILGGVTGFGHGEGLQGSTVGAGVGAGTGAAVGTSIAALAPVAGRVVNSLRAPRPNAGEVQGVMQAGERMGVPVRRADVDPNVRQSRATVLQSNAGQPVRDMEAEDLATMEQALARAIGREGATRDQAALGDAVQTGARGILRDVRNRATRLYNRARSQSEGVTVQPRNMIAAIDENIAELTANGANQNAAQIRYLQGVRDDVANTGGMSIDVLRAQRTQMRGNIDTAGLTMTDMERRMTNVLRAASRDIEEGLANNPQALEAFRQGDRLWREQALFERQIARRIIGTENSPVAPATAAQRVTAFFNNDPRRAAEVWGQLSDETRSEIQAQLTANLGRQANGNFSLATFLTHTGNGRGALIPPRTMRILFGDDGMRAINDLRTLAGAKVAAADRTNRSNTGGIVQAAGRGLRTMILGGIGLSEAGLTGGVVAAGAGGLIQRMGEARAVRLLTNPDFTRWLSRLPQTDNPQAINGAFARLRNVASRNTQFQSDVQAFEQALIGAANDNTGMAVGVAAQPQEQQQR